MKLTAAFMVGFLGGAVAAAALAQKLIDSYLEEPKHGYR